jgi:uncharacterized protein
MKMSISNFFLCISILLTITACTKEIKQIVPNTPAPTYETTPTTQPSNTPMPFSEMTIPSLHQRNYHSQLTPLQKNSENDSYTSYLTSYDSDSLKINAQLNQPKGDRPATGWPAIVFVHGYIPPTQYTTLGKYIAYVDYLAKNGFVVLKIDLRGHGNSAGEPGGGYYSADYVIDTLNARAALQSTDFVDKHKVGLWGHSMAGNVTFRALAAQPDIPAVAVWSGAGFTYTDLREYRISDNSYRPLPSNNPSQRKRQELFDKHGQFDPNNEFWKQVTPVNYLSDIKGAVGLFHAVDDDVVSINYSRNLNKILDSTKISHELHEYPTGGHNIQNPSFTPAMQETVTFYKKYLY